MSTESHLYANISHSFECSQSVSRGSNFREEANEAGRHGEGEGDPQKKWGWRKAAAPRWPHFLKCPGQAPELPKCPLFLRWIESFFLPHGSVSKHHSPCFILTPHLLPWWHCRGEPVPAEPLRWLVTLCPSVRPSLPLPAEYPLGWPLTLSVQHD